MMLAVALSLTSCHSVYYDFHQEPFSASSVTVDKSQTAVLSVMVEGVVPLNGIVSVDGVKSPWAKAGPPMWVRVSFGSHKFVVRHTEWNGTWYRDSHIELSVENMLPKHVYLLKVYDHDDHVSYETIDLGESPDYGVALGKGKDRQYHRVKF